MLKVRYLRVLAFSWIVFHLVGIFYLFTTDIKIERDTLSLLSDTGQSQNDATRSPLEISKSILQKDALALRFVVRSDSREHLIQAKEKLLELLKTYDNLLVKDAI